MVTERRFWRRSIGSEQRVASLIDHLAERGLELTVAYPGRFSRRDRQEASRYAASFPRLTIASRTFGLAGWRDLIPGLTARLRTPTAAPDGQASGTPRAARRVNPLLDRPSAARARFVHGLLRELRPAIVIVVPTRLTALVHPRPRALAPDVRFVVDTLDVIHQRAERFRAEGADFEYAIDRDQEAEALATYDAILAIHEGDRRTLEALVPGPPVLCVPHGIELPDAGALPLAPGAPAAGRSPRDESARPATEEPMDRPLRLGFLGGRDASNLFGLSWFLDRVWPSLSQRFGSRLELWVAGQICADVSRTSPGMRSIGPVPTIADFWPQIDIAINPVRFGSGLKIKNVEAMAWARPLVTSPIGAEGLERAAPHALAIADEADQWIDCLATWVEAPEERAAVGRAGRRFAETHFAPSAAFAELDAYVDRVLGVGPDGADRGVRTANGRSAGATP